MIFFQQTNFLQKKKSKLDESCLPDWNVSHEGKSSLRFTYSLLPLPPQSQHWSRNERLLLCRRRRFGNDDECACVCACGVGLCVFKWLYWDWLPLATYPIHVQVSTKPWITSFGSLLVLTDFTCWLITHSLTWSLLLLLIVAAGASRSTHDKTKLSCYA